MNRIYFNCGYITYILINWQRCSHRKRHLSGLLWCKWGFVSLYVWHPWTNLLLSQNIEAKNRRANLNCFRDKTQWKVKRFLLVKKVMRDLFENRINSRNYSWRVLKAIGFQNPGHLRRINKNVKLLLAVIFA